MAGPKNILGRPPPPAWVGRYQVLGELGGGGMATVYLGRVTGPGGFQRLVAVKRLHEHLCRDGGFVQMFLNEARIAGLLHHPGIVPVFEVGEAQGRYFIVMDYVRGETLSLVLNRAWRSGGGVPTHLVAHLVAAAADAVHVAHELRDHNNDLLGVIHRDLSPRNLMLGFDGTLRILDFGVARLEQSSVRTRTGTQKGTVAYMAPEQILGRKLDRRVDIFALGTVLWEATVGKRLFASHNDFATAARVRQANVPPPSSIVEHYPGALEQIVLRALRREPDERYATALELAEDLRRFAATGSRPLSAQPVVELMLRVCPDRLDQRLRMERQALEAREESEPVQMDAVDSGSLFMLAAVPTFETREDQKTESSSVERLTDTAEAPQPAFLRHDTAADAVPPDGDDPLTDAVPVRRLRGVVPPAVDGHDDQSTSTGATDAAADTLAPERGRPALADPETERGLEGRARPRITSSIVRDLVSPSPLGAAPVTRPPGKDPTRIEPIRNEPPPGLEFPPGEETEKKLAPPPVGARPLEVTEEESGPPPPRVPTPPRVPPPPIAEPAAFRGESTVEEREPGLSASGAMAAPLPVAPGRGATWALVALAIVIAGLVAAGGYLVLLAPSPAPARAEAPAAPAPPEPAPTTSSAAVAASPVRITLALAPAAAKASVDGQPVEGDVFETESSTRARQLEVGAPGYRPAALAFVADQSKTLTVALVPEPPPAPPAKATRAKGRAAKAKKPTRPRPRPGT